MILDESKFASLERKADRLDNVIAFVKSTTSERPAFLENVDAPCFEIGDVKGISKMIKGAILAPAPLFGLVLAGGKSTRMRQDKTKLEYHGKPQHEYMFDLLSNHCEQVFSSCRKEQEMDFSEFNPLPDRLLDMGPFGAIISAFMHNPNAAWLVVAVDLPFVDDQCLKELIDSRDPSKTATTFHNEETGFPDPLLTIWETRSYIRLLDFLNQGYSCPRKVLINSDCAVVSPSQNNWLQNVNTPEQLQAALKEKPAA